MRPQLDRAVFLDRDGTLTHDAGYTYRVDDLRLLDHVVEGLRLMSTLGLRLIVTTNQSGIARGYFTVEEMHAFNQRLIEVLREHGIALDAVYYCPYHPAASVAEFRLDSPQRKPQPGMILQAAREHHIDLSRSYTIGDKKSDILSGKAAGCTTILVLTGMAGADEAESEVEPDYIARDLLEAAQMIQRMEAARESP
ncbi:MAG: HAD family hydrolase [Armatimonadota bacterium]|nr:HAD family hydrolase [Armatimonadota bacterium]